MVWRHSTMGFSLIPAQLFSAVSSTFTSIHPSGKSLLLPNVTSINPSQGWQPLAWVRWKESWKNCWSGLFQGWCQSYWPVPSATSLSVFKPLDPPHDQRRCLWSIHRWASAYPHELGLVQIQVLTLTQKTKLATDLEGCWRSSKPSNTSVVGSGSGAAIQTIASWRWTHRWPFTWWSSSKIDVRLSLVPF